MECADAFLLYCLVLVFLVPLIEWPELNRALTASMTNVYLIFLFVFV